MSERITVTPHAEKRTRERMGIPKRAVQRMAEKAWEEGFHHRDAQGRARRYLDRLYLSHRRADNMRVHGSFVWMFGGSKLLTVLVVDPKMRGRFAAGE